MNAITAKATKMFNVGMTEDGYMIIEVKLRGDADGRVELSICGSTRNTGGQNIEMLREIGAPSAGWNVDKIARLRALWTRWHLNAMRASCTHQSADEEFQARLREEIEIRNWTLSHEMYARRSEIATRVLDDARRFPSTETSAGEREILSLPLGITTYGRDLTDTERAIYRPSSLRHLEIRRLGWIRPDEHPRGCLCAKCPTCGHAYGSAWLYEPLDVAAVNEIRDLFGMDVDALMDRAMSVGAGEAER